MTTTSAPVLRSDRLIAFVALCVGALVLAGAYGAVHNQITYSIAPEYFTHFKFAQFGIPPELRGRVGASLVGWLGSWWMGIPVGISLASAGLFHQSTRTMVRETLRAFGWAGAIALAVGLVGLGIRFSQDADTAPWIPDVVADRTAFFRVEGMHSAGYAGGLLGLLAALVWQVVRVLAQVEDGED